MIYRRHCALETSGNHLPENYDTRKCRDGIKASVALRNQVQSRLAIGSPALGRADLQKTALHLGNGLTVRCAPAAEVARQVFMEAAREVGIDRRNAIQASKVRIDPASRSG